MTDCQIAVLRGDNSDIILKKKKLKIEKATIDTRKWLIVKKLK